MSGCPELDIADAVVASLNAGSFTPALTAARGYLVEEELLKSTALKCTVMTAGLDDDNDTRGGTDVEVHTVGIAIYQKLPNVLPTTVDPLVALLRAVRKHFNRKSLAGAKVIKRRSKPLYDAELLQTSNVFCGFVELDCRLVWQE